MFVILNEKIEHLCGEQNQITFDFIQRHSDIFGTDVNPKKSSDSSTEMVPSFHSDSSIDST
jgi:hypothetical protein